MELIAIFKYNKNNSLTSFFTTVRNYVGSSCVSLLFDACA